MSSELVSSDEIILSALLHVNSLSGAWGEERRDSDAAGQWWNGKSYNLQAKPRVLTLILSLTGWSTGT